jgi:hypothetical protein
VGVFRVPTAVWGYGFLRALAFALPPWLGSQRVGVGVVVQAVLFAWMVPGGRRGPWVVLVVLDVLALALLVAQAASGRPGDVPLVVVVATAAALGCLLWPSTRRHAGLGRQPAV